MIYPLMVFGDWAHFILRVVVAVIFLVHGWPKFASLKATADNFNAMGFRPGKFWAAFIATIETLGGLLLLIGLGTQIVSLVLAVEMIVSALWKVRRGEPFAGGCELDVLLIAVLLVLATWGGGVFGADNAFRLW